MGRPSRSRCRSRRDAVRAELGQKATGWKLPERRTRNPRHLRRAHARGDREGPPVVLSGLTPSPTRRRCRRRTEDVAVRRDVELVACAMRNSLANQSRNPQFHAGETEASCNRSCTTAGEVSPKEISAYCRCRQAEPVEFAPQTAVRSEGITHPQGRVRCFTAGSLRTAEIGQS